MSVKARMVPLQAGGKRDAVLLTSRRAWVRLSWGRGGGGGRRRSLYQGRKGAEGEEKKRFADQMRDSVGGFKVVSPLWEAEDF